MRCNLKNMAIGLEGRFEPFTWRLGFVILGGSDTWFAVWVGPFSMRLGRRY